MISESRRLQYLDALGIDAWVSRDRAARQREVSVAEATSAPAVNAGTLLADSYIIGPGTGQTLLLCNRQEEASSRLASDIARCLDEAPVWGWQAHVAAASGPVDSGLGLESAIRDRLFTRVLLFGAPAADTHGQSAAIGSARVVRAPSLPELGQSPEHKRALWLQLVANGWCKRFE